MKCVFLGAGNEIRGDDGIGTMVVEALEKKMSGKDSLFIKTQVPENHIYEVIKFNPDILFIIDSADFKGKPGEFRLIEEDEVMTSFVSTHTTPLTLFLKAVKAEIKPKIYLIGTQYKDIGFCSEMSKEVKRSVKGITDYIVSFLKT